MRNNSYFNKQTGDNEKNVIAAQGGPHWLIRSMMWSETSSSSNAASQQVRERREILLACLPAWWEEAQVPMTGLLAKRKRDEAEDLLPVAKLGPRLQRWLPACSAEAMSAPPPAPVPSWPPEDDSPPESDEDDEDDDGLLLLQPVEPRAAKPPLVYNRYPPYPEVKQYFTEPCTTDVAPPSYYRPPAEPYCPPPRFNRQHQHQHHQQQYWPSPQYCYPSEAPTPPPQPASSTNQTIRCAENGKSYLELGSSPVTTSSAKCSSRTSTYRQQRLAVLNISMCKLSRFRQFPDPSLHRSVLICNTLRRIEREMEHDSQFFCSESPHSAASTPTINYPSPPSYPATPPPQDLAHYEHSLRDLASPAPRATPFPSPVHPSSDSDSAGTINWGSVLSLSSQSDLDPLNNNGSGSSSLLDEFDAELLPSWRLGCDDVLKPVPAVVNATMGSARGGEELVDSLMNVLVGT
ncbi:hypothetical protein B566_EDAN008436 [Ephemera danica]|nr:hypothetical protein B566_EDAN008436 [Ephemera danica]